MDVQPWLSQSDGKSHAESRDQHMPSDSSLYNQGGEVPRWRKSRTSSLSSRMESSVQKLPNKTFKQHITDAIFTDLEQAGGRRFSNPAPSFPAVCEELLLSRLVGLFVCFGLLVWFGLLVGSLLGCLIAWLFGLVGCLVWCVWAVVWFGLDTMQEECVGNAKELLPPRESSSKKPESSTSLSTDSSEDSFCTSSEGGTTALEADDSSDGGSERIKCPTPMVKSTSDVDLNVIKPSAIHPKPEEYIYSKPICDVSEIEVASNDMSANGDHGLNAISSNAGSENATTSCKCIGAPQSSQQPLKEHDPKLAVSHTKSTNSSINLLNPSSHTSEQLVNSTEQEAGISTANEQLSREADNEKFPINNMSGQPLPLSWDEEVLKNCSDFATLTTFIQSLPVGVYKDAAQGKTLCHTLVGLVGKNFSSADVTYLLELLGEDFLQQCMVCQDFSGNTPLHCAIEAKASADVVKFLLRFATSESGAILNNDSLTPLELSFEQRVWLVTQMLIHQSFSGFSYPIHSLSVVVGTSETLLLSRLIGLFFCFGLLVGSLLGYLITWWFGLVGCLVWCVWSVVWLIVWLVDGWFGLDCKNTMQEEYDKSSKEIPFEDSSCVSSSEGGIATLEANDSSDGRSEPSTTYPKAKKDSKPVCNWGKTGPGMKVDSNDILADTHNGDFNSNAGSENATTSCKCIDAPQSSQQPLKECDLIVKLAASRNKLIFGEPPNKLSQTGLLASPSTELPEDEHFSSDHKNESICTKSSKFTSAQRTTTIMEKKQFYKDSSSEYSEPETMAHDTDEESTLSISCGIKPTSNFASCAFQIFNFTDNSSTPHSGTSTELHHAVRRQCFQSVRDVLACDRGKDHIQMMDEEGHTPLQFASLNKDFELLLESSHFICSQVSPSPSCSGYQQITILTSIVKVLSKIDTTNFTLHSLIVRYQHCEILYAAPSTVLTIALLRIDLVWSESNQLLMYTLSHGDVKWKTKNHQVAFEVPVQEQGIPSQSELVSVNHMSNSIIACRPNRSSLVLGITLSPRNNGIYCELKHPPIAIDATPVLTHSEKLHQKHQQLFRGDAGLSAPPQTTVHPSSLIESSSPQLLTLECIPCASLGSTWQACIEKAVDCLHAGYYSQMLEVLKFGKVPPSFPPEIAMAAQFGCALAYYKLEKYSEAAKHLESLKTIAASAHSCGNESIASVYLGDIEFTQSRYTEAAKHYSHALKLYNSDNLGKEYRLIVPTFSAISAKLGTAFRNTSKVVDTVQAYRQAIATADSKKDKLSAHTSLGNLFQSVGENASALAEYEHSIKLSEELRDYVSLGWAHGNMGNAYLGLYQRDKGLYHLEKPLDLTVEHEPTPQAIGRAYNNLGTAYQALDELDKAEEKYDLALGFFAHGNDLPGQAGAHVGIGNVMVLKKHYKEAIPHYTEVLRLSRDRSTVSTAFHNRGCSYYEWAESKKATLPQKARFSLHDPDLENCEVEHQPSFKSLPNSILKYYQLGRQDLEQVIKYHEETFENIKGSSKGLTLSVSLFETNSRTFHRLQDCLVNLGEWEKALAVAEQSRTRTLGELLVKRKNSMIDNPLTAPLNLQSIADIVQSQHSVVVYLSYTGARLLGWVLAPTPDKVSVNMFEVPLEDDQFDGKSFDYHLRYSLTEELVERSFEMYRAVDYKSDLSEPVRKLYKLVCKPLMKILKELKDPESSSGVQEMIIIPDGYTCLLPFPCLLDEEDKFLGDSYSFRIMPSLLTMGIIDQLPSVVVQVPADGRSMCVVGNPTIPSFMYNGDQWSLGKLPFATREAEWVANILKTTPILHEQATKDAVLMRIMNAKVIHIATQGSASAGFLASAGMSSARNGETVEAKNVYPEDIERLSISPALVVLSSCDSGRGTVKADGILEMAQAFMLAGAQAVLTTLWRVPDESASVFMQFFYQYLMDGLKASLALQKSTLSMRCFSKYSQYIHWSGYQLTGGEIQFDVMKTSTPAALEARLGKSSVFPRLELVQQLESVFLKDPHTPSDMQILRGSSGAKPSEPLIDFIHSIHDAFQGGIFWINGRRQELIDASAAYIRQATRTVHTASPTHPILIVFDHIDQMPQFSDPSTSLVDLLKHSNTHIVIISKKYAPPDALLKEIDSLLLRGCNIIDVKPLSPIHTTQRIVHSILSAHHLAPTNEDQNIFEKLAQFTSGSPALIDVTAALFLSQMKHDSQNESQDIHDTLVNFSDRLSLDGVGPSTKPVTIVRHEPQKGTAKTREISKNVYDNIDSIRDPEQDPWCTSSPYDDSWQAVTTLIDQCSLSAEEKLLLFAVSMFSCSPIPMSVVTEISSMIAKASQKPHISTSLHSKLFQMQLMKRYPLPVILHPSLGVQQLSTEPEFFYVPQYIAQAIWKDMMSDRDQVAALTTMYIALRTLADNLGSSDIGFLAGLTSLLVEMYELNYELMGKQCYQEVYKFYLHIGRKLTQHPEKMTYGDGKHAERQHI